MELVIRRSRKMEPTAVLYEEPFAAPSSVLAPSSDALCYFVPSSRARSP